MLLKNETVGAAPLLPLAPTTGHLAVIGRLAGRANLGDHGSSRVRPPSTVSPLQGLREALPGVRITTTTGQNQRRAAALAAAAETAIVVVGLDQHDEGESVVTGGVDVGVLGRTFGSGPLRRVLIGLAHLAARFVRGGDRSSLTLRPSDERLIQAVVAANPRTVVVLIGGSAILTEAWRDSVPALLMAWYGGMEGGRALASVLTGSEEPGGRLPFVLPTDAAHLPFFDSAAKSVEYDDQWGQRRLDGEGHRPAFPFGFGLGYTTIEHRLLEHTLDEYRRPCGRARHQHRRPQGLHRRSGLRRGCVRSQTSRSAPGLPEGDPAARRGGHCAGRVGCGSNPAARSRPHGAGLPARGSGPCSPANTARPAGRTPSACIVRRV